MTRAVWVSGILLCLATWVQASDFQLQSQSIAPNPFTPDGNGITDTTAVAVQGLLTLDGNGSRQTRWDLEIVDSQGKKVWDASRETDYPSHGAFPESWSVPWDGFAKDHQLCSPGTYTPVLTVKHLSMHLTFALQPIVLYQPGSGNDVSQNVVAGVATAVALPEGQSLSVPAGAAPEGTVLILRKPADDHGRWNAVEVLPEGLALSSPASLTILYNPGTDIPPGKTESDVKGLAWDAGLGAWRSHEPYVRDESANTVTLALSHFSIYAAGYLALSPPHIASISFSTSTGMFTITLDAAGVDAASYTMLYGRSSGTYTGRETRISVAYPTLTVPFLGYDAAGCDSTVYLALASVDAAGNESSPSNEMVVSSITTVWPVASQNLASIINGADVVLRSNILYYVPADTIATQNFGKRLTIEPGTVIKMNARSCIYLSGTVSAGGDECRRIHVTSWNDNSVGGDTGTGLPHSGDWGNVIINQTWNTAAATLAHCVFKFGGGVQYNVFNVRVYLTGANLVTLTHCEFSDAAAFGLQIISTQKNGSPVLYAHDLVAKRNPSAGVSIQAWMSVDHHPGKIVIAPPPGMTSFTMRFEDNGNAVCVHRVQNLDEATCFEMGPGTILASNNGRNAVVWEGGDALLPMRWYDLGVPYVLNQSATIASGKTLQVDAGVIVKAKNGPIGDANQVCLTINGALLADGIDDQHKVVFTSLLDDSHGGDTNNDLDLTQAAPGDWGNLIIREDAQGGGATLNHCLFLYGGGAPSNLFNVRLYLTGNHPVTITHCEFSDALYFGLQVISFVDYGSPVLFAHDIVARRNQGAGLSLQAWMGHHPGKVVIAPPPGMTTFTMRLENNGNAISIHKVQDTEPPEATCFEIGPGTITVINNGRNAAVWEGGDIPMSMRWYDIGIPYVLNAAATLPTGKSLQIDPGVIVKAKNTAVGGLDQVYLDVFGTFLAGETNGDPIVFTSLLDDAYGGDTNNDGATTSPAPGDWGGLRVHPNVTTEQASFTHCMFLYGGGRQSSQYDLRVSLHSANPVTLSHCQFLHSLGYGLQLLSPTGAPRRVSMEYNRFANNAFAGLWFESGLTLSLRNCSLYGNNPSSGLQINCESAPDVYVDAPLCYWGYEDLDGHPVVPQPWRISPWYTQDPLAGVPVALEDWTGDFNPSPLPDDPPSGIAYKDTFKLALSAPTSVAWHSKITRPDLTTIENDTTGGQFSLEWGAGQVQEGKYTLEITDPAGSFPPIRANAWADFDLYAALVGPGHNSVYGTLTEEVVDYKGVLQTSAGLSYATRLWQSQLPSGDPDLLATAISPVGQRGQPAQLVPDWNVVNEPTSQWNVRWEGGNATNPARGITLASDFLIARIGLEATTKEVSSLGGSAGDVEVRLSVGDFPGTVTLDSARVVKRTYLPTYPDATSLYHCHNCLNLADDLPPESPHPDTFFTLSDATVASLGSPVFDNGVYTYTWSAGGHGDGLYAAQVHTFVTLASTGQSFDRWFGTEYKNRDLAGWAESGNCQSSTPTPIMSVDPDPGGDGIFEFDGRHLLKYSFPAGWKAKFPCSEVPVIFRIVGGVLTRPEEFDFTRHDVTTAPMEGVSTGPHDWYWDGVLRGHLTLHTVPYYYAYGGRQGLLMGEMLRPDTDSAYGCSRSALALAPEEFVVKDFGDVISPVLTLCAGNPPESAKIRVEVGVLKDSNLVVRLWRTGEIGDTSVPSTPAVQSSVIPVTAAQSPYIWEHDGQIQITLPGGSVVTRRLMQGLYEVEVIATAKDASNRDVVQRAAQVIPVRW